MYGDHIEMTMINLYRLFNSVIIIRIMSFFIITLFVLLYVRVVVLLSRGKHVHDYVISREKVCAHKISLTPSLFY